MNPQHAESVALRAPYTLAEIEAKIASHDYNAELMLQHAMLLLRAESAEQSEAVAGLPLVIASAPEHIYLDLGELAHLIDPDTRFSDLADVTWSEDNATGHGIKYVRADVAASPAAPAPCATEPDDQGGADAGSGISDEQIAALRDKHGITSSGRGIRAFDQIRNFVHAVLAMAPATTQAQEAVAYLDIGAGGYMDLGTELTEAQLAALPKGRHMLKIAGTYGVDGYQEAAPTVQPSAPVEAVTASGDEAQLLADLVSQIDKCNPVDDHGHDFKMNAAYLAAKGLL